MDIFFHIYITVIQIMCIHQGAISYHVMPCKNVLTFQEDDFFSPPSNKCSSIYSIVTKVQMYLNSPCLFPLWFPLSVEKVPFRSKLKTVNSLLHPSRAFTEGKTTNVRVHEYTTHMFCHAHPTAVVMRKYKIDVLVFLGRRGWGVGECEHYF